MANFVLVPGAWLGSWAWDEVAAELRKSGHEVHALTLSGLAERAGPDAATVGLTEHVHDVVSASRQLTYETWYWLGTAMPGYRSARQRATWPSVSLRRVASGLP